MSAAVAGAGEITTSLGPSPSRLMVKDRWSAAGFIDGVVALTLVPGVVAPGGVPVPAVSVAPAIAAPNLSATEPSPTCKTPLRLVPAVAVVRFAVSARAVMYCDFVATAGST